MRHPNGIILKAFLSRCEPNQQKALERFLPQTERLELAKISAPTKPFHLKDFSDEEILENVHWSWFLPTLKTYPISEQKLFLSTLNSFAAKNLAKTLTLSPDAPETIQIAKTYLRQILLNSVLGTHHRLMPARYLPASSLNRLLNLSKQELTHRIDLLALHDLAADLRQIVETKILKKIYSLLSEEERTILKRAMEQKEHFAFARMGIDQWDGSEKMLRTLLHRRGLARLGSALSGQDSDLIWYICHKLDIGRGTTLLKHCKEQPNPGVSDVIIRQIEELL